METRYTYSSFNTKPTVVQALQLRWSNWNSVGDFLGDKRYFGGGVFLDDVTGMPLGEGKTSSTIGMYLHTANGQLLVRQNDYIVRYVDGSLGVIPSSLASTLLDLENENKQYGQVELTDDHKSFPNV